MVGSSRKQHLGRAHQAGGQVEPATHPTGVGAHECGGEVGEIELYQEVVGAGGRRGFRQAVQPTDRGEIEVRAHQPVDGRLLRRDADVFADRGGVAHDVETGDRSGPFGRLAQGGENADRGGLPCAVMSEQTEHRTRRNGQVEIAQGPEVAESFTEAGGGDPADAVPRLVIRERGSGSCVHDMNLAVDR